MTSLPSEFQPADQLSLIRTVQRLCSRVFIYLQEDVENISIPWVECTTLDHPGSPRAVKMTDVLPYPSCAKPNLACTCGLCQNNVLGLQLPLLRQLCSPNLQFSLNSCSQNNTKKKFQQLQVPNQPASSPLPLPVWVKKLRYVGCLTRSLPGLPLENNTITIPTMGSSSSSKEVAREVM
jgi:hypothetical protein